MSSTDSPQARVAFEDPADTARYIGAIAVELRGLASDAGLDFLALVLDMAIEEAESRADNASGANTVRG